MTDVDFNRLQTSFLQNMLFVSVVEYQLILCEFAFEATVVDRMRSEISAVTFRGFSLVEGRIVFLPTASHSSRKDEGKHKAAGTGSVRVSVLAWYKRFLSC